jgi:hypothetical protein
MQTIRYQTFLPPSAPMFCCEFFCGNGNKKQLEHGDGSDLSRTGFICIILVDKLDGKQMQTHCYRASSTSLCILILFSGAMNVRRKKRQAEAQWIGPESNRQYLHYVRESTNGVQMQTLCYRALSTSFRTSLKTQNFQRE